MSFYAFNPTVLQYRTDIWAVACCFTVGISEVLFQACLHDSAPMIGKLPSKMCKRSTKVRISIKRSLRKYTEFSVGKSEH